MPLLCSSRLCSQITYLSVLGVYIINISDVESAYCFFDLFSFLIDFYFNCATPLSDFLSGTICSVQFDAAASKIGTT